MIRIVHLGKYYPPDMGGTEIITQLLAQAANKVGYEVSVVCFDQSGTGGISDGRVEVLRYPVTRMLNAQPLSFNYFFAAIRKARKANIVHLHAPNLLAALAVLFIGLKPKLLVHWHTDVVGKGWLGRLVAPLEWLMLKRATVIVATSQRYADSSTPLQPFLKKVRVVPLGANPPQLKQKKSALSKRLSDFVAGRRFVLSVGRLSAYKGFSVLVEAARHLPEDVAVIIAGGGELACSLSELIAQNELGDRVLLAGRVSQDELATLYENAELFCLPSILRSEAFGVVLLEAMACGLPVVATNIGGSGVSWVNAHEVSGLNVTPGDAQELAAACASIMVDPKLRLRYSTGAIDRYQTHFTEAKFRQSSLAVYKDLLSRKK